MCYKSGQIMCYGHSILRARRPGRRRALARQNIALFDWRCRDAGDGRLTGSLAVDVAFGSPRKKRAMFCRRGRPLAEQVAFGAPDTRAHEDDAWDNRLGLPRLATSEHEAFSTGRPRVRSLKSQSAGGRAVGNAGPARMKRAMFRSPGGAPPSARRSVPSSAAPASGEPSPTRAQQPRGRRHARSEMGDVRRFARGSWCTARRRLIGLAKCLGIAGNRRPGELSNHK